MRNPRKTVLLASILLAGILVLVITAVHLTPVRSGEEGPLSNATVSFGAWMMTPPFDRFPNTSSAAANHHELIPREVKIKAGGTVNFIIAGLHQVIVYNDGTQPGDINTALTTPTTGRRFPRL